jgi:hypothetical protein
VEISIYSLLEGAERATGAVAVIDVFRAFTTSAGWRTGVQHRNGPFRTSRAISVSFQPVKSPRTPTSSSGLVDLVEKVIDSHALLG